MVVAGVRDALPVGATISIGGCPPSGAPPELNGTEYREGVPLVFP